VSNKFAKSLRRNSSEAEKNLWWRLRDCQLEGYKVRRQVPLGEYIADFVCFEARLVVEVDGGQHDARRRYDAKRTEWLNSQGFKVLRFWNNEALGSTDAVLEVIRHELLYSPHPNPLPQGEREREGRVGCGTKPPLTPSPLMGEGEGYSSPAARRSPLSPVSTARGGAKSGFALISSLLFLLVITLLGVSLFLGINLQEKAAGNTLEKTRALELANTATTAAENWLATLKGVPNLFSCSANSSAFRVCVLPPKQPSQPDTWMNNGATPLAFADLTLSRGGGADVYYRKPGVWISYLGQATMGPGDLYRIDSYAWGGNAKSLVVTETVFYVGGDTRRSTAARNVGQ
jgi:very-short-patch-repair endonuclease/Tfp pilus assembly protein PilX